MRKAFSHQVELLASLTSREGNTDWTIENGFNEQLDFVGLNSVGEKVISSLTFPPALSMWLTEEFYRAEILR